MNFEKSKNKCKNCNNAFDILVNGFCVECFDAQQKEKSENPLDKFEFESDEFEEIQDEYIKKDIKEENSENMIVHARPKLDRAIDKIIKVTKNKKK